jgi:Tfp pilus assembly protein PilF
MGLTPLVAALLLLAPAPQKPAAKPPAGQPAGAKPAPEQPAEDYVGQAVKALDANQPAAAESILRKAVSEDAADFTAHFHLALALSLQNKDEEGIAEYRRTLELKPALFEANLNLGMLLLRNKRPAEALTALEEADTAKPGDKRVTPYLALALLETGDAPAAEQHYREIVRTDPSPASQTGLANALKAQGKLAEAAEAYRAAADKPGLLAIAAEYEARKQPTEAIAIYQQFPDDGEVRRRLGQLQIDSKNAEAAIASLEDVVRKSPNTQNRLALADAYKLAGQPAKVLEQLQSAVAAEPGNFELRMALGRQLRDEHKLMPAAQHFQVAVKLDPTSVAAWNELANVLLVSQNYTEGLSALDHVRALGKEIPGNFFLRAITYDKLKMKPQALAEYKTFLTTSQGQLPDQEFQARQRIRIIELELKKK